MNQSTPSQSSRLSTSSKSWRRFSKVGAVAAVLVSAVTPMAKALVLTTNTLTIAATGTLDVKVNNVIVNSAIVGTAGAPGVINGVPVKIYSGIQGYVQTGLYGGPGGFWDGPGIDSSAAAADPNTLTAVGVLDNGFAGYGTWPPLDPHTLTGPEILAKYTWFGDADLDGIVSGQDQSLFNDGFNNGLSDWVNGDFDYNGVIDSSDQTLFNSGFNGQTGPLVSQGSIASVPEPTGMALVSVGVLGLLAKRRKHKD